MLIRTLVKLGIYGAILGALIGHVGPASAAPKPFMATTGRTSQPIGHYEFCLSRPSECDVRSRTKTRVNLTPQLWNQLVSINAAVNQSIRPATDEAIFGRPEVWTYPSDQGDCEDFVLLKRRQLIAKGWPVGTLLITVVRQRNGEGHAVLTVLTDRGDFVLDNLDWRVVLWSQTDYRYVKRQSEFNSGRWTAVDDARTTSVGSLAR